MTKYIKDLSNNLRPIQPITPMWKRMLYWTLFVMGYLLLGIIVLGKRNDLFATFTTPTFIIEFSIIAILCMTLGLATLTLSIPGQTLSRLSYTIVALIIGWGILWYTSQSSSLNITIDPIFTCAIKILLAAIVPIALLRYWVLQGVVLNQRINSMLLFGGCGGVGFLIILFHCHITTPMHTLLWHFLPFLILFIVGYIAAPFIIKRH